LQWNRTMGHTTSHLAMPTRGFTAAVSVFGCTPSSKPS
jgi:hypothetical protein